MIKIDVDTRKFEIPWEEKLLGVESDEKVKKLKFEVSKNEYFSGLNFTDSACYINYKNGNVVGQYGITDVIESDGKVTFTWEVSREATRYKGKTYAILCAKKVREDGTIIREWNSAMGQFNVYEGIEPSSVIIEEPEIDIISQLLAVAQQANANALTNIEKSEENISKSEELIQLAQSLVNEETYYKGVIVDGEEYSGKASNSGIKLHKVVGKTEQGTTNGYQLFDASKLPSKSDGGANVNNNKDGSYTIGGSGNLSTIFNHFVNLTKEETLKILKKGTLFGKVDSSVAPYPCFLVYANGKYTELNLPDTNLHSIEITEEMLSANDLYARIRFYGDKNETIKTGTIKPMFYQDGDGTWEQYTGGKPAPNDDYPMEIKNVEITKINSGTNNLFDYSKISTKTQDGATVTNNNDGSFTISGSGNLSTIFNHFVTLTKEETLKIIKSGKLYGKVDSSVAPYPCFLVYANGKYTELNLPDTKLHSIEITEEMLNASDLYSRLRFYSLSGQPIKTGTVKPMLYQDGDGTWEPFKHATVETSITLAEGDVYEDGVVTRKSKHYTVNDVIKSNISSSTNGSRFKISTDIGKRYSKVLCNYFKQKDVVSYDIKGDYISTDELTQGTINIRLSQDLTIEEFKQKFSDLMVEIHSDIITKEELKVPTVPSYYPNTNIWTDNTFPTDMQWKILADSDRSLEVEENEKRIEALEKQIIGG